MAACGSASLICAFIKVLREETGGTAYGKKSRENWEIFQPYYNKKRRAFSGSRAFDNFVFKDRMDTCKGTGIFEKYTIWDCNSDDFELYRRKTGWRRDWCCCRSYGRSGAHTF
ncbi:MAG: hypothetical protein ACOCMX_00455 [Acetivibrio ethanolgignens]